MVKRKTKMVKKTQTKTKGRPRKLEMTPGSVQDAARRRRKKAQKEFSGLGGLEGQTLVAPQREGYYRRFVADRKGRIDSLLQRGYYFVSRNQEGSFLPCDALDKSYTKRGGGTKEDGTPLLMYLMEIPESLYLEDQQAKERRIRAREDTIRTGTGDGTGLSSDVSYDPTEGGQNAYEL